MDDADRSAQAPALAIAVGRAIDLALDHRFAQCRHLGRRLIEDGEHVLARRPERVAPVVGTPKVGTLKVGIPKVGTLKVGTPKVGTLKVGTPKVGTPKVGTL